MKTDLLAIKELLDESYLKYNSSDFIQNDPISIPHLFTKKEDIEIAGFLIATIAWGNRKSIITNGKKLMQWMDESPHEFIKHFSTKDLKPFKNFVHRTFNGKDCEFFLRSLKDIYQLHGGLENTFGVGSTNDEFSLKARLAKFRAVFLQTIHLSRSEKHVSDVLKNSSCKRLCMYLRWMVRKDKKGVDFGIWNSISPSELCLPLDVHTGNVSRAIGLLNRKQNDWNSVEEITKMLRTFDAKDPIKYDFSLFGLGVDGVFK